MTRRSVDPDFLALPRRALADAALSAARAAGAGYADLRIHRLTTEVVQLRDGELETSTLDREIGLAVRVIVDGTWGFASHAELDPAVAAETARRAVRVATTLAPLNAERIELAAEPVYDDLSWVSDYRIDPFTVPGADKIAVLADYSERLLAADGVDHVSASLQAVKEQTYYADTFGTSTTQQRVRLQPSLEATTVDPAAGTFETMRTLAPPTARGWEAVVDDSVWNWSAELAELPALLAEKVKAPSVTAGPTDLVIDPTNLWLTIHESVGHATEYDRAIGYEAAYAGTSFATPDKLNSMRYGSPVMNVTADRTVEHGLATVGFDDEGVRSQSWDLVRDGLFVGYQLDRVFAPRLGKRAPTAAPMPTPAPCPDPADGECVAAAGRRGPVHRGSHRAGVRRHLHRRRQELVDRYAAVQLPVHRAAVLPDPGRQAGRAAARCRVSGHHHRVLGVDGSRRRAVHLAPRGCVQLRQGAARSGRPGQPRLPVGVVPRVNVLNTQAEAGR